MTEPPASMVSDTVPLADDYQPAEFPGREEQRRALLSELLPGLVKATPVHAWVHGPPGSGKSSVVRSVLAQLEEHGFRTVYVNCWSSQTFFSVLESILDELRALIGEKREISFKFERLRRIAKENLLMVALDEVDQMFLKERNAALYNLFRLENMGVICLSKSRGDFLALDPRVCSRFRPSFHEFPPYSEKELFEILLERAERSLEPDAWCRTDLDRIARSAGGDARIAIQALRLAAYSADKAMAACIRPADIEEGLRKSGELRRRYVLKALSEHHRLLYQIAEEAGQISSTALWRRYVSEARERGMEPMARRTFNHYKRFLVRNRLLKETQGNGRQNVRMLTVVK